MTGSTDQQPDVADLDLAGDLEVANLDSAAAGLEAEALVVPILGAVPLEVVRQECAEK